MGHPCLPLGILGWRSKNWGGGAEAWYFAVSFSHSHPAGSRKGSSEVELTGEPWEGPPLRAAGQAGCVGTGPGFRASETKGAGPGLESPRSKRTTGGTNHRGGCHGSEGQQGSGVLSLQQAPALGYSSTREQLTLGCEGKFLSIQDRAWGPSLRTSLSGLP